LNNPLAGAASMVGARDTETANALHTVPADHDVLERHTQRVPDVQPSRDVRRRHHDHKRAASFAQILVVRLEVALLVPPVVEIPLHGLGVIGFGQLHRLCVRRIHPESLFRESLLVGVRYKKAALTLPGRVSPRYHLASVRTAPLSNALTGVPATRYIRDTDLTGGPHGRRSVFLALPRLPVPGRRLPGGMHTYSSRSSEVRQVYAMTQAPLDQRCEAHCT